MRNRIRLGIALFISAPSFVFAADTLIFAVDLIRHGDRTPVSSLPAVHYEWKEGLGQLTAEGMQQEYNLGQALRKKYIEQTHLLPEHYQYGTIYARSTDYHRTLMSAESLLVGLYPPGTGPNTTDSPLPALPHGFQPIPVFSAPSKYDDVIIQEVNPVERIRLLEQYVYSTKEWQQKNTLFKDKYPVWSRLTGMPINGLEDMQLLGHTLYIHQLHNAPMPDGLSNEDIKTIIDLSDWVFMAQEKPQQIGIAHSTRMMTNIVRYLDNASQQKTPLKYVLLSAHDTTIARALSFMGAPLDKTPPYASNLNFALYESGANYYTVHITFNGSPVSIPACGGSVCELQQFKTLVNTTQ